MEKVEFIDRDIDIESKRIALGLLDINVPYQVMCLIIDALEVYDKRKSKMNIKDALLLKKKSEEKWKKYFEDKERQEEVEDQK